MAQLDIFRISDDKTLTDELLSKYIMKNDAKSTEKYQPLWDAYQNDYEIYDYPEKSNGKPDVRVSVNLAKFITDVFEGFFLGVPLKLKSEDEAVEVYMNALDDAVDMDDQNVELSNIVSVFGRGYRIVFVDENGDMGCAYLDPMESFAIYNESITPKMRYFVRTYMDEDNVRHGSVADETTVRYFKLDAGEITWEEEHLHGFNGVPAVEFVMNRNRTGIYESVMPLINEYNKALSEKSNDVEYFADAYLKVLGAKIDEKTLEFLRDNRTINIAGIAGADVVVDFLQKPNADTTQEHLLDRIERLIFMTAMVCNISDDNFATSSGIALRYKMLPMINLAATKWRKFVNGLNRTNKLICSNPVTPLAPDDWQKIKYVHTLNYPANIAEESQSAANLSGITSRETQLSLLSIIDNVDDEMEQIKKETQEEYAYLTDFDTTRKKSDHGGGVNNEEKEPNRVNTVFSPTIQKTGEE